MALIEWNESFSVGVEKIDSQHRQWIELINALDEALGRGKPEQLGQVKRESIEAMIAYARFHFEFEETFMKKSGYPHLVAHREDHNRLRVILAQIQADSKRGFQPLNTQLMNIMMNWMKEHIMKEDKKIGDYVDKTGKM